MKNVFSKIDSQLRARERVNNSMDASNKLRKYQAELDRIENQLRQQKLFL